MSTVHVKLLDDLVALDRRAIRRYIWYGAMWIGLAAVLTVLAVLLSERLPSPVINVLIGGSGIMTFLTSFPGREVILRWNRVDKLELARSMLLGLAKSAEATGGDDAKAVDNCVRAYVESVLRE